MKEVWANQRISKKAFEVINLMHVEAIEEIYVV